MKLGDVLRMTSFSHHEPTLKLNFRAAKGKAAVFIFLGEENKDGSQPLDLIAVMDRLGWKPK